MFAVLFSRRPALIHDQMVPAMIMSLFAVLVSATMAVSGPGAEPKFWKGEWPKTDFSRTSIKNWTEILSGGPPRDGIPAISDPSFVAVTREKRLKDREPVISVELKGQTPRAYPIRYLLWHEIINDKIGNTPIAVTFCPLCNSGIVFDRRLKGRLLDFGVTGKLRNSDMIMYDRQTESWWQQALGQGIVGKYTGAKLKKLPVWMESWAEYKARNPKGLVMDEPSWNRSYGRNPYVGYDSAARPFLYNGENPPHGISPLARVVAVGNRAWTLERLRKVGEINEAGVKISWHPGQASALDTGNIGKGRDVGNIRVRDAKGRDVVHDVMFAFAFHAFHPNGKWMLGK